jgi:Zn-dependent protease
MSGPLFQLVQGFRQGSPEIIISTLLVIGILLLICFPFHEFAHAYTATRLGDDTARLMGRLTLNPLAHLDVFGSILFLIAGFGWAKPVPVTPYRLNGNARTSMALVALAGPASNVFLAILFALIHRITDIVFPQTSSIFLGILRYGLELAVYLNMVLALFNLIPVPPLDGSRILVALLPDGAGVEVMGQLERYGFMILILLTVAIPGLLSALVSAPAGDVTQFLIGR